MADDLNLRTGLAAVLHSLENNQVTDLQALMMLKGLIDRETNAPAYVAFQKAYLAYVKRREEIETRRSQLMAVDDPAYLLRHSNDSAS